jgi:uncharacterized membrane protein
MTSTRTRRRRPTGWLVPLCYMAGAIVAGLTVPRAEHHLLPWLVSGMSPAAAMTIGAAVASGMISLTAIVFSLAFVMVQFSATAYSPRLVLWIARDPVLSHAMGLFSATFLYSLLMITWVDREGSGRVPLVSEWLIFGLLLASMAAFVTLIERVSRLQVNQMLIFTGDRGREAIGDLYAAGNSAASPPKPLAVDPALVTQVVTHVGRPQTVQAIRVEALVAVATTADATIELLAAVGDTLVERTPVIRVIGARQPLDVRRLTMAIDTGDERTFEQDPKYALRLLVDIAIRALSPAVNDPTTAVQALDQIEDLLIRLGNSQLNIGRFADATGRVRLMVPFPTWDDFLRLALDEIRMYGRGSTQIMRRMSALLAALAAAVLPDHLPAVRRWEERLDGSIALSFSDPEERREASVEDRQGLGIGHQT